MPVYVVHGALEDVRVLERFRTGELRVHGVEVVDESKTAALDVGGLKVRLLGLGGGVVAHKMCECTECLGGRVQRVFWARVRGADVSTSLSVLIAPASVHLHSLTIHRESPSDRLDFRPKSNRDTARHATQSTSARAKDRSRVVPAKSGRRRCSWESWSRTQRR